MTSEASAVRCGLDELLAQRNVLKGRRYGLLCHQASLTRDYELAHLALSRESSTRPARLFEPEHGFFGVEQDMIEAKSRREPATGIEIVSLYGTSESSLRPDPACFDDLDLVVLDLQDVGARYYTFVATALFVAEVAQDAGVEVWVLDRPNPLGGELVEGPLVGDGLESFVSAFRVPNRHGLTLAELFRLEWRRRQRGEEGTRIFPCTGWRREARPVQLPWIAPSPNMPTLSTAWIYPGLCLVEATELSEGRGTTRPFHLVGAPHLDPESMTHRLQERLETAGVEGVRCLPSRFRPQFQKHAGAICGGVELVVTDPRLARPTRLGVELLLACAESDPEAFRWRTAPYEFVTHRAAIDLLTGSGDLRRAVDDGLSLDSWLGSWPVAETRFIAEASEILLYEGAQRGASS